MGDQGGGTGTAPCDASAHRCPPERQPGRHAWRVDACQHPPADPIPPVSRLRALWAPGELLRHGASTESPGAFVVLVETFDERQALEIRPQLLAEHQL